MHCERIDEDSSAYSESFKRVECTNWRTDKWMDKVKPVYPPQLCWRGYKYTHVSHSSLRCFIIMTAYECHGISNHRHLDCLFDSWFALTSKETSQLLVGANIKGNINFHSSCSLLGESTSDQGIPITKGQYCRDHFHVTTSSRGVTSPQGYITMNFPEKPFCITFLLPLP